MKARRDFSNRVVGAAVVVRLVAIVVALVGLVGQTITGRLLAAVLVLSASSLALLLYPKVTEVVERHPLLLVIDVLISLAVIGGLGVESPLVLATFSTALIIGVLTEPRVAALGAIVLCAGYLVVVQWDSVDHGFMLTLGVPTLYAALVAIGAVVRSSSLRQIAVGEELAEARHAASAADERARLAREMHDSLGKTVHGLALAARALPMWVERDPATAVKQAEALAAGADQAAQEARELLVRMRSDQPDRPLVDVLTDTCARWEGQHTIQCTLTCTGTVDLPTDARYEVLAIVTEALENVARHAHAHRVDVRLEGRAGVVQVRVADDGLGFSAQRDGRSPSGHFGLTGMHERAEEVGATLQIVSAPGVGTTVLVEYRPSNGTSGRQPAMTGSTDEH